ncbi:WXG100 family type VII secretion target [Aminipila sp.]|uniref:WXG100 family type VII secretion target n=1 Tax=Aminipila sp. TaxID=2060095 RepID=UPI001D901710|nr:WXG100 family type VII secretion target [Aminipila sp.]MBE6033496.1 WXG100 family type VII secretion target [Clostridiales bacterium]
MSDITLTYSDLQASRDAYKQKLEEVHQIEQELARMYSQLSSTWSGQGFEGFSTYYQENVPSSLQKVQQWLGSIEDALGKTLNEYEEREAAVGNAWRV